MVLWQLRTLDHLDTSEFGRPFPRHGLQLLFWFSNHCVSFELNNSGDVMKLVSECQPEKGVYGFHKFGNVEELLPVLYKPKKNKSIRQRLGSLGKRRGFEQAKVLGKGLLEFTVAGHSMEHCFWLETMQDAGIIGLDLLGKGGAVVDVPGSTLRLGMEVVTVIH
ncbi:hypothetical protein ILYODFUR_029340 [Ilyodon furcidens]|uniref:Uncharacterized protein n=1 Tax=Ilyodon furcidens TaxID=33524 RepID=A0ABV0U0E3_9TELE